MSSSCAKSIIWVLLQRCHSFSCTCQQEFIEDHPLLVHMQTKDAMDYSRKRDPLEKSVRKAYVSALDPRWGWNFWINDCQLLPFSFFSCIIIKFALQIGGKEICIKAGMNHETSNDSRNKQRFLQSILLLVQLLCLWNGLLNNRWNSNLNQTLQI